MASMNFRRFAGLLMAGALASAGCSGKDGQDGRDGQDGTSCTVAGDGSGGAIVTCADGSSVAIPGGDPGSCTIAANGDGTRTIACSDGTSVTVRAAARDFRALTSAELADLDPTAVVTAVEIGGGGKPLVRFRINDRNGNGLAHFVSAAATGVQPTTVRFGLLKLADAGAVNGSGNQTWVSSVASAATSTPPYETPTTSGAVLTDGGDGSYTFAFSKDHTAGAGALAYEPTKVHRLVVQISTSGNPYRPMNAVFDFVPATGAVLDPDAQEAVDGAACTQCHGSFRAKAGGTGALHGGDRYDVRGCVLCHNDQSRDVPLGATMVGDAAIAADGTWIGDLAVVNGESVFNFPVLIHKVHMGRELELTGGTYRAVARPWEVTYPQDVRNCAKCHRTNGKAGNWSQAPSRRACGACHDDVSFAETVPAARRAHPGGALGSDLAGPSSPGCGACHPAAAIARDHTPAGRPDPLNYYANASYSVSTNAGWVPAVGVLPPGASKITFEIDSVSTTPEGNPQIVFRLLKQDPGDAAASFVTFNPATSAEMIDNFTGSPSVYFAFGVPQSGVAINDDWSASTAGYLKDLWKGTAGTLTGPTTISGSGSWYTATLTNAKLPAAARHLTGAVGLNYSLKTTPPLTQIAPAPGWTGTWRYPYNAAASSVVCGPTTALPCDADAPLTLAPKMGGLVVAAATATKVATGHTARRTIVATARCNGCHGQLGSAPNFHVGQRNDAGTCAFCHSPNKSTAGWAVNAKDFIHAIHAAEMRTAPFTWQLSAAMDFTRVTYPAPGSLCTQCHLDPTPGGDSTFDFSAYLSEPGAAMENLLPVTAATGKFDPASPTANRFSPYVVADNVTSYGTGFSFTASTGAVFDPMLDPAGLLTRVHSPVAATCFSCHDTRLALGHIAQFGGRIYDPLSEFVPGEESCLMCHGKGKIAAIQEVHQ
jgi:OmcA/MtrC family decaheme c-type cytochrome